MPPYSKQATHSLLPAYCLLMILPRSMCDYRWGIQLDIGFIDHLTGRNYK
jgi:hypothetical protein